MNGQSQSLVKTSKKPATGALVAHISLSGDGRMVNFGVFGIKCDDKVVQLLYTVAIHNCYIMQLL